MGCSGWGSCGLVVEVGGWRKKRGGDEFGVMIAVVIGVDGDIVGNNPLQRWSVHRV